MTIDRGRSSLGLMIGVSALALCASQPAMAQTPDPAVAPVDPTTSPAAADAQKTGATAPADAIVVTGIRGSLKRSMDIKKNAIGVVDAISAEEMGKFPDTNLAEALQRITGVSIDRANGEGSRVTVRGFGPEFNLVLLDGRQMPTSSLGDGASPPSSRSFDFANLAAEGISAVEVYKSGNVRLPTGGIGSTINIVTPRPLDRPGMRASMSAKAIYDTSQLHGKSITPEVSGIFSDTFADNRVGILVTGSYSRRKASISQFSAGWRSGYYGNENNWESIAVDSNDWRNAIYGKDLYGQITNHPGPTDVYQVPQNAAYDFIDIDRKRINGQAILQFRPTDTLTGTIDYVFSQNTVSAKQNSIGVWFTGGDTTSSWTNGPAAGPLFFSEQFHDPGKDLAITGSVTANRTINHSIGGNITWKGGSPLRLTLDAHHSTAESKPTSSLGSSVAVGSAIFGVNTQTVDFTHDIPVISVSMYPGSALDNPGNIRPAGNAFRNAYMKDRIDEVALKGGYDFDASFIKSLDFGISMTDNKVRSAYGFLQNNTWGGTLSAADTPDSLYKLTKLPPDLSGMNGSNDPSIIPVYYQIDTTGLVSLLQSQLGICTHPDQGTPIKPGSCLAQYSVDRRIKERTLAPYIQSLHEFPLFGNPALLRFGLRYERTKITSSALVPIPIGTSWDADNEIAVIFGPSSNFTTLKGKYHNFLPEADFEMSPLRNFKLRASYSHTITRASYADMQGGLTIDALIRPGGGGVGSSGNPGLLPYLSKNIDLSAEWYYGSASYASIGFFHKNVKNFPVNAVVNENLFGLTDPSAGPLVAEARAALGSTATTTEVRQYIIAHHPEVVNPATGGILGTAADPLAGFLVTQPSNGSQKANLYGFEFNVQHSFWDTGFGAILNYTLVRTDSKYHNQLQYLLPQFAVTGVSDSANAVLFYDKNGLQARVAYNWRGKFLSGYSSPGDPHYVAAYGQWDANASYEFRKGMTAFVEGINVTNADRKGFERNTHIVDFAQPGHARYAAGIRVTF